jgi:hypothetical protein
MRQRREFLAGNPLDDEPVAIAFATKSRYRHSSMRKRDLDRVCKP